MRFDLIKNVYTIVEGQNGQWKMTNQMYDYQFGWPTDIVTTYE